MARPGSAGSEATPQASARRCRASASVTGSPPGSRSGATPMPTRPWTLPAPSGSATLRAPARSSSSDCSLTTAAPVPARSSVAPSVAHTTAGRTSTSLAAMARMVAASTPASSAMRSGRTAASMASSSRSCGTTSPASRRLCSSLASSTAMMPLSTSGICAGATVTRTAAASPRSLWPASSTMRWAPSRTARRRAVPATGWSATSPSPTTRTARASSSTVRAPEV